jgi:hypothetical protein
MEHPRVQTRFFEWNQQPIFWKKKIDSPSLLLITMNTMEGALRNPAIRSVLKLLLDLTEPENEHQPAPQPKTDSSDNSRPCTPIEDLPSDNQTPTSASEDHALALSQLPEDLDAAQIMGLTWDQLATFFRWQPRQDGLTVQEVWVRGNVSSCYAHRGSLLFFFSRYAIGHLPQYPIGSCFESRYKCRLSGIHPNLARRIHGNEHLGALSIILWVLSLVLVPNRLIWADRQIMALVKIQGKLCE